MHDHTSRGATNGPDAPAPTHDQGTPDATTPGTWQTANTWPIPGTQKHRWYLTPRSTLTRSTPRRSLEQTFTVHTAINCPEGGVGPFMQPCHTAGEGLSITSDPLPNDLTVTGNAVVSVPIAADHPDVNIFAYLEDVGAASGSGLSPSPSPDHHITVITEGRLKASLRSETPPPFAVPDTPWHRAYAQDASPLQPGQFVTLHFDLMPTSYVIHKGHRLQLTLMGADYRERARDPDTNGARITVRSTSTDPAWLDLPVVDTAPSQ
jgi:predicted acyl esterase